MIPNREPRAASLVSAGMTRLSWLLVFVACGPPAETKTDAPATGGDGMCGTEDFFTGEIVDWDSTDANFCGVFQATFTVANNTTITNLTNPNGRFQLCIPQAGQTVVNITPPTAASQCNPSVGLYEIPGMAIATHAVIATGQEISTRAIGMNRVTPFFSEFGITPDPAKAIVFVHVDGTAGSVVVGAAHDQPLEFDGSAWGSGDSGVNVVFPNVVVGSPATTSVAFTDGSGIGGGTFPVAANTFTYVTLVAN
jgi:hypothetical protein